MNHILERISEEEALIDSYVNSKYANQVLSLRCEDIAFTLVTDFFIPQGRLIEANSWTEALPSGKVKDLLSAEMMKINSTIAETKVNRLPNNQTWVHVSAAEKVVISSDQQYHYDRTLNYMFASEALYGDVEDIVICRNEWITFQTKIFYKGLKEAGAEFETLASAVSDYIEYILLRKFGHKPKVHQENSTNTQHVAGLKNLRDYLVGDDKIINKFESDPRMPKILDSLHLAHFPYAGMSRGGSNEELFFTDQGIIFLGNRNKYVTFIPAQFVSQVVLGSEDHTEYKGFSSSRYFYWTITITTTQYETFTRWIGLGSEESSINRSARSYGPSLENVARFYPLSEGSSWQTTGGYTTSIGWYF